MQKKFSAAPPRPPTRTLPGDAFARSVSLAELGPADDRRSARKRRAIVEAATATFLENGYLGTSMDQIASVARVSKPTVYQHFGSKEQLFITIILGTVDQLLDELFHGVAPTLEDTDDLEADLRDLARRLVKLVMRPRTMQLRRLVIGEAGRFPELGRTWYERGPGRLNAALAPCLQQLADRGRLIHLDDPLLAANHFSWLVLSTPQNRVLFCGDDECFTDAELEQFADSGVTAFLSGYVSRAAVNEGPAES
jgi:TetR/AcrR family transcriptional repressor of mexJK operon